VIEMALDLGPRGPAGSRPDTARPQGHEDGQGDGHRNRHRVAAAAIGTGAAIAGAIAARRRLRTHHS
jgi:hypothetical protein